jgi:hypothetical protein
MDMQMTTNQPPKAILMMWEPVSDAIALGATPMQLVLHPMHGPTNRCCCPHLAVLGSSHSLLNLLANAVVQLLHLWQRMGHVSSCCQVDACHGAGYDLATHRLAQQLLEAGRHGGQAELVLGTGLGAALHQCVGNEHVSIGDVSMRILLPSCEGRAPGGRSAGPWRPCPAGTSGWGRQRGCGCRR